MKKKTSLTHNLWPLFFSLLFLKTYSQELSYTHFEIKDGLPTSQVYQSIQDDRGFMWFGTDRGLVRYDGYDFKVYTTDNGLASNVIFGFHRDHHRRIWMYNYYGGISYLEGDSIIIPSFNDSLKAKVGSGVIESMYVDHGDTIWVSTNLRAFVLKIDPLGRIDTLRLPFRKNTLYIGLIDSLGLYYSGKRSSLSPSYPNNVHLLSNQGNSQITLDSMDNTQSRISVMRLNDKIYCTWRKSIFSLSGDSLLQFSAMPGFATLSVTSDRAENIWVGFYENGALKYEKGNLKKPTTHILKQHSVSSIYEDREGGLWFTTLDAGIFYSSGLQIGMYNPSENRYSSPLKCIYANDSLILTGSKYGELYQFNRGNTHSKVLYKNDFELFSIQELAGTIYVKVSTSFKLIKKLRENIWIIQSRLSNGIPENSPLAELVTSINPPPELAAYDIRSFCIWNKVHLIGGENGIHQKEPGVDLTWRPYNLPIKAWILDMTSTPRYLFLATKTKGIIVYDGTKVWAINKADGLPVNHIETITAENDSILWLGSKKGVSKIYIDHDRHKVKVVNITVNEGLVSNEINDLYLHANELWVATNLGVSLLKIDANYINSFPPPVHLEEIRVNNRGINLNSTQNFDHPASILDFQFTGLSYRSSGQLNYKYRLQGFDDEWRYTSNREVRYMLPPGEFTFEVLAQNNSGLWSKTPARYSFSILAPFWKRWWFILLMLLISIALLLTLITWRLKTINEKRELELQMAKSRHSALNAQLKPHFVFNALNSVNNYILKNDKKSSSKYLHLFSKLIRQILTNSNEPIISLEQELKLVKQYLEIEQLRFRHKMTYEILIDEAIDCEIIQIPTQIIQPYVENAIWHGIMNKEGSGNIKLELVLDNDEIHCIVEDNGVGRKAALALRSQFSQHKSSGMEIGRQRLKLIQAIFKRSVSISVKDLADKNKVVVGTRVLLKLPIITKIK